MRAGIPGIPECYVSFSLEILCLYAVILKLLLDCSETAGRLLPQSVPSSLSVLPVRTSLWGWLCKKKGGGIILSPSLSSHSLSQLFCVLLVPYFHIYIYFLLQTSRKFSPKKDESPLTLLPSSTQLRNESSASWGRCTHIPQRPFISYLRVLMWLTFNPPVREMFNIAAHLKILWAPRRWTEKELWH